jgi:hypothetical protein
VQDRDPRATRRWWVVLAITLMVAVAVPLAWAATRPYPDVGSLDALAVPLVFASPSAPATAAAAAVPVRSGRLGEQVAGTADPVRLRLPAAGIDAPVVPVAVETSTGGMQIPENVDSVGWYTPNPPPGAPEGATVLSGHVDSRAQGRGAFFTLEQTEPGDVVTVDLADGTARDFEVVARRRYTKDELPAREIFATAGPPQLVLITCGGAFDSIDRHYQDNVVVYAVPR